MLANNKFTIFTVTPLTVLSCTAITCGHERITC